VILTVTRWLLYAFGALTLIAFVALFVGASLTDRYFAWTIKPPVTAAFLGAAYAAGGVLEMLAVRSGTWLVVRIPFVTILVFALITLLATLLHLDRFHFGSDLAVAWFAAWFWTAIYLVVPLLMIVVLWRQERSGPVDDPHSQQIPRPVGVLLAVQGVTLLGLGVVLFAFPGTEAVLWPWTLTPLTARAVAAWLIAFGFGVLWGLRSGDLTRLDVPAWAYGVFAVLQLVVLARFPAQVRWSAPATWAYLALLVSILVTTAYALRRLRMRRRAVTATASPD
jgi:hypothetical protein